MHNISTPRKGRIEDKRLVTGAGKYTDDIALPGALHAVFVRSPYASARLNGIDASAALEMPGVVAVLTGADMQDDGVGPFNLPIKAKGPDGREWRDTPRPLLVQDRVRHLGEPLAIVVAETRVQALDAAEAVAAELEELGAVASIDAAAKPSAPLVHEDRPGNLCFQWERGDWDAVGDALENAAAKVAMTVDVTRVTAVAMEPRNALAIPEKDGHFTFYASHQKPPDMRAALSQAFDVTPAHIRAANFDVGGAFGMKSGPLREEMVVFWAAKHIGRPVRWRADRSESFMTDEAGRDVRLEAELALGEDGKFLALRVRGIMDCGAYATARSLPMMINFGGVAGVYATPMIAGRLDGYLTHTVPVAAYRGAGRPEATLIIEQLIDKAARQIGVDPVELRRRNLITPDQMPWKTPFIYDYDCGDFPAVLAKGLEQADVDGFASRRQASEANGKLRGLGVAMCLETAGGIYGNPGRDFADVEVGADGQITLAVGAFSAGQGLETGMTDLAASLLEVPPERIRYVQGDTDVLADGKGMGGSAAMVQGGSAVRDAVGKVIAMATELAGEELEVATSDIEYRDGVFSVVGTDRRLELVELARIAAERGNPLAAIGEFAPKSSTFPNGCHVCEIEIDPESGAVRVDRYSAVEDIGTVLNPQIATGQIHGGVVQALGQVFMEKLEYEPDTGQLLTGSFMDYAMPRASDLPMFKCGFHAVPTKLNPLGVKGVGEAGSVGALAAGMNAVSDAMTRAGVQDFQMPATPGRIWQALNSK